MKNKGYKRVCIIPARGGSKRIPHKNKKLFHGKPIITYAIENALNSNIFDDIIVSSDDDDILQIAASYKTLHTHCRPAHLADDVTSIYSVVQFLAQEYEQQQLYYDSICCLYPTTPLLRPNMLQEADDALRQHKTDFVLSVQEFMNPVQRSFTINNNYIALTQKEQMLQRTQDLSPHYYDVGQFFMAKNHALKQYNHLWDGAITPYICPPLSAHDIDTEEDWVLAELAYTYMNTYMNNTKKVQ